MGDDNIGRFFNYYDMEGDDKADNRKPVRQYGNALYRKSIDILNLAQTIGDILPEEDDDPLSAKSLLMQNAYLVPAKIQGAFAMEYYS